MISSYFLNLTERLRLVLLGVWHLDHPIFLQLGEEEVGNLTVLESTPVHRLIQFDYIFELKHSLLILQYLANQL